MTTFTLDKRVISFRRYMMAGSFCIALFAGYRAPAQLQPVSITTASFTVDVIAEGALHDPTMVTNSAFDGSGNNIFYTIDFKNNNPIITAGGLPISGAITNGSDHWQMAPYTGNNCLFFPPQTAASTQKLALSTPAKYSKISLLNAASGGSVTNISINLHFKDGTTSYYGNTFSSNDWFGGTTFVINNLGRIPRTTNVQGQSGTISSDPRLYQMDISLVAADQARTLDSVFVTDGSTNNSSALGIFAVSGLQLGLPLEVSSLRGNYSPVDNAVKLSWDAYSTNTTAYFEVERSLNGRDFQSIAKLVPARTGTQTTYSFTDQSSLPANQNQLFYRIKETLFSGSVTYSVILRVAVSQFDKLSIRKTPNFIYLLNGQPNQSFNFRVINFSGQEVQRGVVSNANNYAISIQSLDRGAFVLVLENSGDVRTFKFVR